MKTKIVICCGLLLAVYLSAFAQVKDSLSASTAYKSSVAMSAQDYMQKGRNQKTTAIILGAAGGVLSSVGFLLTLGNLEGIFDPDNPPKNETLEAFMWIIGGGLCIASIPYYISAAKNKNKAFQLLLENSTTMKIEKGSLIKNSSPAFTLKIEF